MTAGSYSPISFRTPRLVSRRRAEARDGSENDVSVVEVRTRRERKQFVDFPEEIYRDDPYWCAPLKMEEHSALDPRRNPFFEHGAATQFLAYRAGRTVGRILVSDDPNYNAEHQANVGCFGMFETMNDESVAYGLLNAAADWLRQRGRTSVLGPIDFSTNYRAGLLVEGFDTPQRVLMNHHAPYYADLLTSWGLVKTKDLYAWWFDTHAPVLDQWTERVSRLAGRAGVTVRSLQFNDFDAEVDRCLKVYNQTWEKSWGFVPMTSAEFRHMALQLKQTAVPELILLAEVAGQPVGFCVTLPDLNEALRPLRGRLTSWGLPIGFAKLLWNLRKIRSGRTAVLGVLPGYRRRGIAELLILKAFQHARYKLNYSGAELGWTLEDNEMVNRTIESVGGRRYKRYRIYERAL